MNNLELKIPPLILVFIFGVLMWLLSFYTQVHFLISNVHSSIAAILFLIGAFVCFSGVLSFRAHNTTVNPTSPQETTSLVTSGVYKFSRNPMYVGFLFFLLSWASYLSSAIALLGPIFFVLYMNQFQIKPEEKMLNSLFGDAFDRYKQKVRRWL